MRSTACLAAFALTLGLMTGAARAVTTYTYTGNNFNAFAGNTVNAFTTNHRVTISFTTASTLLPSTTYALGNNLGIADLLGWQASDGLRSYGAASPNGSLYGTLQTNAAGAISLWGISISSFGSGSPSVSLQSCGPALCMQSVGVSGAYAGEYVQINPPPGSFYYAGIASTAGAWTVTAVPEPHTAGLLLAGVAVLLPWARRRH